MGDRQAYPTLGANVVTKQHIVSRMRHLDGRNTQRLGGRIPPKSCNCLLWRVLA
jgi:hypothetical protein